MANENNSNLTTTNNPQITAAGYRLPAGFNDSRQPGELAALFDANSDIIYNKFSAKTPNRGLFKFGPQQPFVTRTPNNHSTLFSTRAFPLGNALTDVERITKWQLTGDGVVFTAKQFLLQGQNSFNETKLYNPLMPILSVASTLSFGVIPTPTRHIDLSSISALFGFGSSDTPPNTTVGRVSNQARLSGNAYKGLLRGATASEAHQKMIQKWSPQSQGGSLLANYFKSGLSKIFGQILPIGQPDNTKYRGDEGMYGIMLASKGKFATILNVPDENSTSFTSMIYDYSYGVYQMWNGGTGKPDGIRKKGDTNSGAVRVRFFRMADGTYKNISLSGTMLNGFIYEFPKIKTYEVGLKNQAGKVQSYEYSVGAKLEADQLYKNSEQLVNYAYYIKADQKYPSKFIDRNDTVVKNITSDLNKLIDNLNKSGYIVDGAKQFGIQQFRDGSNSGYTNIVNKTKDPYNTLSPENYNGGYMTGFKDSEKKKQLLSDDAGKGFATTGKGDKLNLLDIALLDSDAVAVPEDQRLYDSYRDDQIAFFFYDMVNDKYIPFRATIKGLSESMTAEWNDVNYIGRADKMFTYKGFSRSLTFNFTVAISSIQELLPTWKKINYFCGMVKPAAYTGKGQNSSVSRFIIPPMVRLTVGDMYKNQPCIITSIGLTVPEDATWETLCEDGGNNYANEKKDWCYLNGLIIWKGSKGKYAQFPKVADINVSMHILEKETPIVGGSQFGDAYRDSNLENMVSAGDFSEGLIV